MVLTQLNLELEKVRPEVWKSLGQHKSKLSSLIIIYDGHFWQFSYNKNVLVPHEPTRQTLIVLTRVLSSLAEVAELKHYYNEPYVSHRNYEISIAHISETCECNCTNR